MVELFCSKGHVLVNGHCTICEAASAQKKESKKIDDPIEGVWDKVVVNFQDSHIIEVWTRQNEFKGEKIAVSYVEEKGILICVDEKNQEIHVEKRDICAVVPHWDDYVAGKIPRSWLANGKIASVPHTKEVMSILYYVNDIR